jgi:hypothetical protein
MCKLEGNMFIVNFNSYNPNILSHKFKLVWGAAVQREMSIELWYLDSACQRTHVVDNSFKNRFSQWHKEEEKIHLSKDFQAQSMHLHMRAIISLHRVLYPKQKVEQIEPPPLFGWWVEYAWFLTYVAELGNRVVKYGSSAYCEYGVISSAAFAIWPSSWILSTSASRDTKFACKKLYLVK